MSIISDRRVTKRELLKIYMASEAWDVQARNFNSANHLQVWVRDPKSKDKFSYIGLTASELFKLLAIDIISLSQIFVKKSWEYYTVPQEQRSRQPSAKSYGHLGVLRICDKDGWRNLARLLNKKLRLQYTAGEYNILCEAIFFPNSLAVGT